MTQEGASAAVTFGDCELYLLKCAFDTFPKDKPDYEVCRQLAEALTKRERYVEAINFWHKVELVRPEDELPKRSIATLTVLQHQAKDPKYEADKAKAAGKSGEQAGGIHARGPSQTADPAQPEGPYRLRRVGKSLPELRSFRRSGRGFQAEARGIEQRPHGAGRNRGRATPRLAFQDGRGRQESQANGQARRTRNEYKQLRMTVIEKELDVYSNRCERYPNNLIFRYELAQRYQWKGDIGEAIKQYQIAVHDPRKRGKCLINLGECFRAIKQFHLAMDHFEQAVQEIPDRDQEEKKLAYYRAGTLAMGLKDLAKADKYLTTLASMDYTYRDTSDLLERLHRMQDEEGKKGGGQVKREDKEKKDDEDEEKGE